MPEGVAERQRPFFNLQKGKTMKKKILSIMLCALMVLVMGVQTFASEKLPSLETTRKYTVATTIKINGVPTLSVYCFDEYTDNGTSVITKGTDKYSLVDGKWEKTGNNDVQIYKSDEINYDTTGLFLVENPIEFMAGIVKSKDITKYLNNIQEQIKVSTVVEVLVFVAVAIVGIAFMWWGVRKTARVIMTAFRKGKINL